MDELTNSSSESEDYDSGPIGSGLGPFPTDDSDRQRESAADDLSNDRTDCLHFRGKKYEDLQLEDLDGVEFKTADEVDQFYAYYSLAIGFSVRKHKSDKNSEAKIRRIILVCSRQGQRQSHAPKKQKYSTEKNNDPEGHGCPSNSRKHAPPSRRVTRCNCQARLSVLLCKSTGVYYATDFVTEHNHNLVRREHVRFLRSHRSVMDHDIAQVSSMRKVSISTCQAYELLVHQAGGYDFVGFTLKDLYNHLDSGRREILLDGDAQASISFMNLKALRDPHFYCFFCVDQQGRLANMFWRDSQSLIDYNRFGDVLIMDTTYKTNIYAKPLAVFVGVNNHRATVLFGCALLIDETEETYKWVVSSFLTAMNGKKPISVITDGDEAMRNAVSYLIPDAKQRLCSWHISKNVCSNIHNIDVQKDFFHLIYAGLTVTEWEAAWHYMVVMNSLENNKWVASMYNKRDKWAEAFFRDNFFAGICSTQRCERMHRNLKGGLGRTMRLCDVLPRVDKTIARMRDRVLEDDCRSINSDPVIGSHLRCMQEQIAEIFTHDIFLLMKDQIRFESKFVIYDRYDNQQDSTGSRIYLSQYNKPERRWVVSYNNNNPSNALLKCSCNLFESDGIPCCHIFAVMKSLMITTFPKSLVKRRWTKDVSLTTNLPTTGGFPDNSVRVARYGEMMAECSQLCFAASFSDEGYEATVDALRRLNVMSKRFLVRDEPMDEDLVNGLHRNVVKDPVVCRSKGTHSKAPISNTPSRSKGVPLCGFCSRSGHNIRTCELAKESRNNNGTTSSQGGTISFDNNVDNSERPREDNDGAAVQAEDSDNDSVDLIHHREEARDFHFFAGYEDRRKNVSGSTTAGFPSTSSQPSNADRQSSRYEHPFPSSWPFRHTQ
jgi:zinc finger SWIM domain-containing protein 3